MSADNTCPPGGCGCSLVRAERWDGTEEGAKAMDLEYLDPFDRYPALAVVTGQRGGVADVLAPGDYLVTEVDAAGNPTGRRYVRAAGEIEGAGEGR